MTMFRMALCCALAPIIVAALILGDALGKPHPVALASTRPHGLERTFHVVTIAQFARGEVKHTHVEIEGIVTAVYTEDDGDLHLWICDEQRRGATDRDHCVVGEIIPEMQRVLECSYATGSTVKVTTVRPFDDIKKGDRIIVRGIARFDRENGHVWWEIHPITSLEVQP